MSKQSLEIELNDSTEVNSLSGYIQLISREQGYGLTGFSKGSKLAAAKALEAYLRNTKANRIDAQYIPALMDGRLFKVLQQHKCYQEIVVHLLSQQLNDYIAKLKPKALSDKQKKMSIHWLPAENATSTAAQDILDIIINKNKPVIERLFWYEVLIGHKSFYQAIKPFIDARAPINGISLSEMIMANALKNKGDGAHALRKCINDKKKGLSFPSYENLRINMKEPYYILKYKKFNFDMGRINEFLKRAIQPKMPDGKSDDGEIQKLKALGDALIDYKVKRLERSTSRNTDFFMEGYHRDIKFKVVDKIINCINKGEKLLLNKIDKKILSNGELGKVFKNRDFEDAFSELQGREEKSCGNITRL